MARYADRGRERSTTEAVWIIAPVLEHAFPPEQTPGMAE